MLLGNVNLSDLAWVEQTGELLFSAISGTACTKIIIKDGWYSFGKLFGKSITDSY